MRIGRTVIENHHPNDPNEHVYAICCWPEVAGDVIYGENVNAIEGYAVLNVNATSISIFRENQSQPFAQRVDDSRPQLSQIFATNEQNV